MYSAPEPLQILKDLPKVNLHTHLEGSVRPRTFLDLAENQNIKLNFNPTNLDEQFQVTGDETSLLDYLEKIFVNYQILKEPEALHRTAYEAAEDAHRDGVIYFELRAGPLTHVTSRMSLEACLESMLDGLEAAERDFGIISRLIVAALRSHTPQDNLQLAQTALKYQDQGVVGFDLAGDEAGYSAELHRDAFLAVRKSDLGLTVHAGEAGSHENVFYAVQELEADRIGHGIKSIESQEVVDLLVERQVMLEICPTSNVHTQTVSSIESHPVKQFFIAGVPISIGDDDPITSRTRVSNELTILNQIHGFTIEDIRQVQIKSLQHSFLKDQDLKLKLLRQILDYEVEI